jgi:hypothetical protein
MVARAQHGDKAALVVSFFRDLDEVEETLVPDGEAACRAAVDMIVRRHELQPGDVLLVKRPGEIRVRRTSVEAS